MTSFGINLKRIRLDRKMTQDEFAELLNTSKQVISRYENGQRSPKVSVVAEYARRLNVPITTLTGEIEQHYETHSHNNPVFKVKNIYNKCSPSSTYDDEEESELIKRLWERREALRRDPNRRILFDLAENGTEKDIDAAVALIDALKKTNPDFYDGDDPA